MLIIIIISFFIRGPIIGNDLPHGVQSIDVLLVTVRNRLKIFLFDTDT